MGCLLTQGVQLSDQPDKISWRWTADGSYTAASAYKIQFMGSTSSNLKELIWKTPVPAKQKLSAWMCIQDRCLTADKLAKRGWQHNPICSPCKCQPETAVHTFTQCSFSAEVWRLAFATFNFPLNLIPNAATPSFRKWWEQGFAVVASNESKQKWSAAITLVCWFIWTERNARIFDGVACSAARVMRKIEEELSEWRNAWIRGALLLSPIHP